MDYYFECQCGQRISVRAAQADSTLTCVCGRTNQVPKLSKLSKVSQPTPDAPPFAENPVAGPARALQVFAIVSIALLALVIVFDIVLLASFSTMGPPQTASGINKETQVFVRMIWGGVMLVVNVIIFFGASEMLQLKNYSYAKTAAILAVIPGLSICCVLGIPFGLVALNALNRPGVKESFSS